MKFTIVQSLPKKYMEDAPEIEFVAEIDNVNDLPRKEDVLVVRGLEYTTTGIERNYDTQTVIVYVERKINCNDIFEM